MGKLAMYSADAIRRDFPIFEKARGNGKPFTYLDTAASAQKPREVLQAVNAFVENNYSNIHRGLYETSQVSTELFEAARQDVSNFVNGWGPDGVVFTRGSTEAINLVANSYGGAVLQQGDEIVLTVMEHHANIVPWQMIAHQKGAVIRVLPLNEAGVLDIAKLPELLSERTRIVAFTHISNALGVINPVKQMIQMVRESAPDAVVLVDGSQGVVHAAVDLQELDPDLYVFTGHKLYAPTGSGVLLAKPDLLVEMPPWQGGGDMIERVSFGHTTFKSGPARFEAGTPDIMAVIGLRAAIAYLNRIGMGAISAHEQSLAVRLREVIGNVANSRAYCADTKNSTGIVSFNIDGIHHSDIAMILDQEGVAVRTGHHCCMPLMSALGIEGSVRASLGMYSSADDVQRFGAALEKAVKLLG